MNRFKRLLKLGKEGEDELEKVLKSKGFHVVRTGQENWLPRQLHQEVMQGVQNTMTQAIRHTPDLLTYHPKLGLLYWDAKVNTVANTPFFSLDASFLREMQRRAFNGELIVIAFKDTDGGWYCQWAHGLKVAVDKGEYVLVKKALTLRMGMFLALQVTEQYLPGL